MLDEGCAGPDNVSTISSVEGNDERLLTVKTKEHQLQQVS